MKNSYESEKCDTTSPLELNMHEWKILETSLSSSVNGTNKRLPIFQPTQLASDLVPLSIGENDVGTSMFGNRSVSTNVLSDGQTPGFKSPWGQQSGMNGREANEDDADDPVFIDKMPWIGDGGDRVSFNTLISRNQTLVSHCAKGCHTCLQAILFHVLP